MVLELLLLNQDLSYFGNTVEPDQMASDDATWSGSTLFTTLIDKT